MFNTKLSYGVSAVAIAMAVASAVHAQETTGAIRGQVTDAAGAPSAGAAVTLVHEPTGTAVTTVTDANGFYSARGLRVGGPYTISVTGSAGDAGAQIDAIGVGDPANGDVVVGSDAQATALEDVIVSGTRFTNDFGAGSASNYGENTIRSLPSISRDLKDVARLDPFATIDPSNEDALSFSGTNTRLNQLTVDGIRQNDEFGLNNNGYPTQRSPISLDAVQAVNVSVAPFSVINNGFIGGAINAVTKSGTNSFSGSAFYENSDDRMLGERFRGYDNRTRIGTAINPNFGLEGRIPYNRTFSEKTWGASLGGPILQDTLFFFLSYEKFESEFSLDQGPVGGGFTSDIPRITVGAIDTFRAFTQSRYNYDPGSFVSNAPPVNDEKLLAKIDWNINDDHRLAVTFQETTGTAFNGSTTSAFSNGSSDSQPRVGLESTQWIKDERLTSYNAQLNSQWTPDFSTELRIGYKETETDSRPVGGLSVGQVTVNVADLPGVLAGTGTPQIQFGADNFRHDNYLYSENTNAELIARYTDGAHDMLFGLRGERRDFLNVFVSQSLGEWRFQSYADFQAGRISGANFILRGGVDPAGGTVPATLGTARDGATEFGYDLLSAYAEDNWQINDDLRVTFGLRYDWFSQDDRPPENVSFAARRGFSNTSNLDGRDLLLPRFGFNWTPGEWTVSGGIGRFSTIGTNVQIGNTFGNDGVRVTNAACSGTVTGITDLTVAPAGLNCTFTPGNGSVVALDPNFDIPSAWKYNLTVGRDFFLPVIEDFRLQGDFIYNQFENALYYTDLRAQQIGTAPDGRPVYARGPGPATNVFDLLLTNLNDGGSSMSAAISAQKSWTEGFFEGLDVRAAYTYTEAEDGNPLTSSQPDSSYVRFASTDHNNPVLATSDYEIRHRSSVNVSWARELWDDNETAINIFAQRRSGLPFSFVYHNSRTGNFDNDFGNAVPQSYSGALGSSNQLFYVPLTDASGVVTATSDPRITYATGFSLPAFNDFLNNTGLIKYSGSAAPRNAFRSAAVTTVDLRLSQEIPAPFLPTGKVKGYLDIENFGNLLNEEWGVTEQYPFYRGVGTVVLNCQTPAGVATSCATSGAVFNYSALQTPNSVQGSNPELAGVPRRPQAVLPASTWQIKLGVRIDF